MKPRGMATKVETICGRSYFTPFAASSSAIIPLQPSSFARALAVGDVFEFYRFTSVKVEIAPMPDISTSTDFAVGYSNQTFDTAPTSVAEVIELPIAKLQVRGSTVYRVLELSRQELLSDGPLKWYKTIVGTPSALFETQGNIYIAALGATSVGSLVVEWTVEFSQWNLAAQSPFAKVPAFEPVPGTDLFRKVSSTSEVFKEQSLVRAPVGNSR